MMIKIAAFLGAIVGLAGSALTIIIVLLVVYLFVDAFVLLLNKWWDG